jgi:hypothetical protein
VTRLAGKCIFASGSDKLTKQLAYLRKTQMRIIIFSLILFCLNPLSKAHSSNARIPKEDSRDPVLLTKDRLSDLPFIKPAVTLEKALKIAKAHLGKDALNRKHFFLLEAGMIDPQNGPAFNWHFKWIRWGVRQSENIPLELTVTSEGKVIENGVNKK